MVSATENRAVVRAEFERLLAQEAERLDDVVTLKFNGRLSRAIGRAVWGRYGGMTLEIGTWAVEALRPDELVDVVRHEFAHLVAGRAALHGPLWKAHARRLGASPKASAKTSSNGAHRPPPKWNLECGGCGKVVATRHRRDRNRSFTHRGCGGRIAFIENRSR